MHRASAAFHTYESEWIRSRIIVIDQARDPLSLLLDLRLLLLLAVDQHHGVALVLRVAPRALLEHRLDARPLALDDASGDSLVLRPRRLGP